MGKYDDIIHLDYPYPTFRKKMSMASRGAQFAPFAALTGYDDLVVETGRQTTPKKELSEHEKSLIDMKLMDLSQLIQLHPEIQVTYFIKDTSKEGGHYQTKVGCLKKIDSYQKCLVFTDQTVIDIHNILYLESELLHDIE